MIVIVLCQLILIVRWFNYDLNLSFSRLEWNFIIKIDKVEDALTIYNYVSSDNNKVFMMINFNT